MDTLGHLRTFLAVADLGSFSDAARQLGVVPSVVAKRMAQLEAALGSRLFERSTRRVEITEAGLQLRARAPALLGQFDDLLHSVQRDDGKLEGHLRVMAPTTLTMLRLGPVFNAFMAQHERITMEIALVDLSSNPEEKGFDVAISGRSASYDGVLDVPLCATRTQLVAAPAYLNRHGRPAHPRELAAHACLVFAPLGRSWRFHSPRGALAVEVTPRLAADDNLTLLNAAIAGMGIALLPGYIAEPALAKKQVLPVLTDFPLQDNWFRAYVPRRRWRLARVQALVDWIGRALAEPGDR